LKYYAFANRATGCQPAIDLENRCTPRGTVASNPTLSAMTHGTLGLVARY
jgi:hypothetical protein